MKTTSSPSGLLQGCAAFALRTALRTLCALPLLALNLIVCSDAVAADSTNVVVVRTEPIIGAPLVNKAADIHLVFNKAMDTATLNGTNILLVGSVSGLHPATYTRATDGSWVTVNPTNDFTPGESVTVTVTRGVRATDGSTLTNDFSFEFPVAPDFILPIGVCGNGSLPADTTWTSGNVYRITCNYTIPAGRRLAIEPGVVVKFDSGVRMIVDGTLELQSTPSNKIVFTSSQDDYYGGDTTFNGPTSGRAGDWRNFHYNNVTNVLHDAVIRFGGYGGDIMVFMPATASGGTTFEVRHCVLENATSWAIFRDTAFPTMSVHDCTIRSCGGGIGGGNVLAVSNTISSLSGHGLELGGTPTILGNTVRDCSGSGVRLTGTAGTVASNVISGCSGWAVELAGSSGRPVIEGNTIRSNTWAIYQGATAPLYGGNVLVGNRNTVLGVGGTLGQDTVWTRAGADGVGCPYLVYGNFSVAGWRTLTIEGGVVVKFSQNKVLYVNGTMALQSTASNKVVFTSWRDDAYGGDSNGDGPSGGSAGDWITIYYDTGANNVFHDAVVRYGGSNDKPMIQALMSAGASFIVKDCSISACRHRGLELFLSAPLVVANCEFRSIGYEAICLDAGQTTVDHCAFAEYGTAAIHVTGAATVNSIRYCNFSDSQKDYGVLNDTSIVVDARTNYWGATNGPSTVGPGSGVKVSPNVTYYPWCSNAVPVPSYRPRIISSPNLYGVIGLPYHYDQDDRATAIGSGPLSWSKLYGPALFSIDPASGLVTWTPDSIGSSLIGIMVTDTNGVDVQVFQVQVDALPDTNAPRVAGFTYAFFGPPTNLEASLRVCFTEPVYVDWGDVAVLDSQSWVLPISSLSYWLEENCLEIVVPYLAAGQTYRLFLTDTITDDAGNPLDGEFNGLQFPSGDGLAGGEFLASFAAALPGELRFGPLRRLPDGQVELTLTGAEGAYRIEGSTNLVDWVPLCIGWSTNGTVRFTDTEAAPCDRRFYRASKP